MIGTLVARTVYRTLRTLHTRTSYFVSPDRVYSSSRFIGLGGLGLRARDVRLAYKYYSSALSPSRGLGHAHRVNARA